MSVRVYCPICKGGKNVIWQGSIEEWGKELSKEIPPEWANYAYRHERAHNHQVMVEYPTQTVPFALASKRMLGEAEG